MSDIPQNFDDFFRQAFADNPSDKSYMPFAYQQSLADPGEPLPSLVNVPTGAGKTAAILGAWIWRRLNAPETVGRRLIYCLPMRTLVEQTCRVAETAIERLGLKEQIGVEVLMGGDVSKEWDTNPEREHMLIGTQDMLLSRALNRGYALSRFRWPVQFGLLNNDCLWVLDEVQLMGSGLATSTQLQALRRLFGCFGNVQTIWMSATVKREWLMTADFDFEKDAKWELSLDLSKEGSQTIHDVMLAKKIARDAKVKAGDFEKIAKKVYDSHREQNALKKRNRTLIIVNTVKRAIELHRALKELLLKKKSWIDPVLIHSRFRPPDRKNVIEKLLSEPDEDGTIIVATQVVEAGVDVSARTLFTELAPWPSLVQRFGRCNRRGADDDAIIYWLDVKSTDSAPYDEKDMKLARERLKDIEGKNAGPMALKEYVEALDPKTRERLFQYEHIYVLRQHDLHGLFSTEPDMAGGYTDVSMFVRNIERESDVYVYWRDFKGFPSTEYPPPSRDELCSVRFFALKTLLGQKGFAWQWNSETGKWEQKRANDIRPGMTLLLSTSQGGYHKDHGWTGKASDKPSSVFDSVSNETLVETRPQESMSDEMPSETEWLFVSDHLRDTEAEARELVSKIQFDDDLWKRCAPSVVKGAWWHDVGKTLNRWQEAGKKQIAEIVAKAEKFLSENPGGDEVDFVREFLFKAKKQFADSDLWAKFPGLDQELKRSKLSAEARKRVKKAIGVQFRPGLRHEAASALAAWQEWRAKVDGWNALAVYLVACHHGKVRTVLRGTQSGEDIFGIEPEDALPQLAGWLSSERLLDLRPKAFGATGEWDESKNVYLVEMPSWIQMAAELLGPELPDDPDPCDAISDESEPRKLGPFRLAFLEALIRAADVKASRKPGKGGRNE